LAGGHEYHLLCGGLHHDRQERPWPDGHGKREQIISPAEYALILGHFSDRAFLDLIEMAWHTGAWPQEVIRIEARHVDLGNRRIVLPPKEGKGKKRFRIIYLNDFALELVQRRIAEQPEEIIFRTLRGTAWKASAVNNRFCRLEQSLGKQTLRKSGFELDSEAIKAVVGKCRPMQTAKGKQLPKSEQELFREARKKLLNRQAKKFGTKFCLYAFRHTFANRLLTAGVDSLTVSTLLGHVDGTMLSRVYQHLQQKADHLLAALNTVGFKHEGASP